MPGWLKNKLSKATEPVAANADDELEPTVTSWKAAGLKCNALALDTVELCRGTEVMGDNMLSIGTELQETLSGFQGAVDASAFATIQNLLSGDKVHNALGLARDMKTKAIECVSKSVEMIQVMEDAIEKLPDPIEKAIRNVMKAKPHSKASKKTLESVSNLDKDIEDVATCITSIKEMNLFTALEVGLKAFENFKNKAKVSRDLFCEIRGYSQTVVDITNAFNDLDVVTLIRKVKEMWKCIKLTGLMRKLAEGLGKLIGIVIDLFEETSGRVAGLWKALAFAKDCMMDCAFHVKEAKALCSDAAKKSSTLVNESRAIKCQLEDMGALNASSLRAFRDLADGVEIRSAIGIAETMDDLVVKCAEKAASMVDRVQEGFANLPPIVTDGIPPDAGEEENDPKPANVERGISDLEACRVSIEGADMFHALTSGARGFSEVSIQVDSCTQLLGLIEGFAQSCLDAIESFMGVWDIESARAKIIKLLRLGNLGKMMKQVANQVKRLVFAVIALLKTAVNKFSDMNVNDLKGNIGKNLNQVLGFVKNVDIEGLNKLNFVEVNESADSWLRNSCC